DRNVTGVQTCALPISCRRSTRWVRVVHGGEAFAGSVLITDEVMKALEECIPLAPLHNPANITGINACTAVMGKDVPQVAVFDTRSEERRVGKERSARA